MKRIFTLLLAAAAGLVFTAGAVLAQTLNAEGEVRRVDAANGKITLKHGPIANLKLPAMTLVFRVSDPAMLSRVKPGDTVRFAAEQVDNQYTITAIEPK
ncbi:Cation efflux system protein CusF precursor [Pigmentiphaga humi]|uniref:Cation efflux system protein CusF n=1 Tax=Pigmentiphaga humi TaxID=2478468 RepID=A0A3P4B4D6_9BURK|nr:copper-binding protein [Pigmentiphaga humi]VCU70498.1 Cation efflux system protein CusF precursor [Pigmentiphaga humi]